MRTSEVPRAYQVLLTVTCGWAGAVIASYLGVVAERGWVGSTRGRSRSACGRALTWWETVPVLSWLLLRGRCRCRAVPLPARHLFTEAALAVTTAAGARVGGVPGALVVLSGGGTAVLVFATWRVRRRPAR